MTMRHLKRLVRRGLVRLARPLIEELDARPSARHDESVAQKALVQHYRLLAATDPKALPRLGDVGFRKYSQFEEDGILLYLFSLIPPLNRTCVELCAGNGMECNTTNLIINHGWWGHLFDGDEHNVQAGGAFFARHKDTFLYPPRFTRAWITAANVNELVTQSGARGPIDLLSLDIDGMDYWIWEALTVIEPQVVICETNNLITPERALTVPYDPAFVSTNPDYLGASLAAMNTLARKKGYRLVGTHRFGFNALFIRQGVAEAFFPEVDVASCVQDPCSVHARTVRWPRVSGRTWLEV
jgi:hypothetical protein